MFFSDTFIRSEFLCSHSARPSTITTSSFRHGLSGQGVLPSSITQQVKNYLLHNQFCFFLKWKSEIGQLFKEQLNKLDRKCKSHSHSNCFLFHVKYKKSLAYVTIDSSKIISYFNYLPTTLHSFVFPELRVSECYLKNPRNELECFCFFRFRSLGLDESKAGVEF